MAVYELALLKTGLNEGGYANNPNDKGKETFAGIARKFWPTWAGWAIIDIIKKNRGTDADTINRFATADPRMRPLIVAFYKTNFWDTNKLDQITDQQLAETIYDFGVNHGVNGAAETLQNAYNDILPYNALKLGVDGDIGNKTLMAVNSKNPIMLHTSYNAHRRFQYKKWAEEPDQGQFLNGWLKRLIPYAA
jgi:lysozyme family protein